MSFPSQRLLESGVTTRPDRRCIETLKRRRAHVRERVQSGLTDDTYDERELSALDWAIALAEQVEQRGGLAEEADGAFLQSDEGRAP